MSEQDPGPTIKPAKPPLSQAGAIAYRRTSGGELQVMLVTANSGGWTIPKGMIDPGMTGPKMAEVESMEEAGVVGVAETESIGVYNYDKFGRLYRVEVYPMRVDKVLESWPEQRSRQREWVAISEAIDRVRLPEMADVIRAFAHREGATVDGADH